MINENNDEEIVKFDLDKLSLDEIIEMESKLVQLPVKTIFTALISNELTAALIKLSKPEKEPETVFEYRDLVEKLQQTSQEFLYITDKASNVSFFNENEDFNKLLNEKSRESYKDLCSLVEQITRVCNFACRVESLSQKAKDKAEYVSDIQKFNDQIAKTLERAHKIVEKADSQFVGDPEVYGLISSIFYISANKMSGTVTQEQKSEPVIKKREPSESEIIRLQYIAKANDLYDQLCYDWLPDFEKQIPFVTRAKYEDFINRKLAHFVKSFHMPLTPDTSIEKAKEAHNQITKMFDNLSSIASQSYTANPPEKHF